MNYRISPGEKGLPKKAQCGWRNIWWWLCWSRSKTTLRIITSLGFLVQNSKKYLTHCNKTIKTVTLQNYSYEKSSATRLINGNFAS